MKYCTELEKTGQFDVVVAGGGASGIAAAVSAAELGAKVLIVERAGMIGGGLTIGHVGPPMGKYEKNSMADRINQLLLGGIYRVQDFEMAKIRLMQLIQQHGISLYLNTAVADIVKQGESITEVIIATQSGLCTVEGKVFIDATGDSVLSYLAGETIEMGRKEDGLTQPASLMFTVSGIDPAQTIRCEHEAMDTPLAKGNYLQLCRDACARGELPPTVNIVRLYRGTRPDERMVNATQANGVNALNPEDCAAAQAELRGQMLSVLNFLRNTVEGFENAVIKDSSDAIGIRESRRPVGRYTLTAEDLIAGRKFEDVVVHNASFPIDIHNPSGAGQAESDTVPVRVQKYDIPYRCLLPLRTQNLYLSGRGISGTHRAHASYRVMNIAMNIGEAAGIGAALCAREGVTPAALDVRKVQEILRQRGVELYR